jgi:adenine-specific DNA-methyltransferase
MTDAERLLWRHLRDRRFGGLKFRRQHPVGPFIVDFVCPEKKLIIEVDGGQHDTNSSSDERRSFFLRNMGYQILRFWNNEVLQETDAVLTVILKRLTGE